MGDSDRPGERATRRRTVRHWLLLALLALAATLTVGAVAVVKSVLEDGERVVAGPPGETFRLEYPEGWRPFTSEELQALPSPPLAVLRRGDGEGIVVVRREKPFEGNLGTFGRDLRRELGERVPDFREVSAKVARVEAGNAFFYSYVRERRGTVHTILIVPAGSRSYVVTSVSQPGTANREIGEIITSFSLNPGSAG